MKMLFFRLLAIVLAVLEFFGICLPKQHETPTVTGNGYGYYLNKDEIEFSFDANATTGCSWVYEVDGNSLEFSDSDYVAEPSFGRVGTGGIQYLKFKAVKSGISEITFIYGQQWEGGEKFKKYVCVCSVDNSLNVTVSSFESVQATFLN